MARRISVRYVLQGTLVAATPIHVGGLGAGVFDMVPAKDGHGDYYIPGTSIAGVLRSWLVQSDADGPGRASAWFGDRLSGGEAADACASWLTIDDAVVSLPADAAVEVRDGVGIDRWSGAASDGIKYDRVVLPAGSTAGLSIVCDCEAGSEDAGEALVSGLACALQRGEVRFGAAGTRGLGRMTLSGATVERFDLSSREGILAALRGGGAAVSITQQPASTRPTLTATVEWEADGPLMVSSGWRGLAVDNLPLVTHKPADGDDVEGGPALVLPGSSVKGALRERAERIVRTLLEEDAPRGDGHRHDEQIDVPIVRWLFGSCGVKEGEDVDGLAPGRGALGVDDVLSQRLDPERWAAYENSNVPAVARQELRDAGLPAADIAFHVAVDRWTAAASDGQLYSTTEPMGVEWDPIVIELDLTRLPEPERLAAVSLLTLVLRDLCDGSIPLGFAVNRGMGDVRVKALRFASSGLEDIGAPQSWTVDPLVWDWPPGLLGGLQAAWTTRFEGGVPA